MILGCICFVALVLTVWFKTDALLEYAELLGCTDLFYIDDYLELSKDNPNFSYHEFLIEYHNCFFVRLITCPICLATWAGIFISIVTFSIFNFPIYTSLGLLVYLITGKLL